MEKLGLTPDELKCHVDLGVFCHLVPLSVQAEMTVSRAYGWFRKGGMRHMVVVDKRNCVQGMLTRKDWLKADPAEVVRGLEADSEEMARAASGPGGKVNWGTAGNFLQRRLSALRAPSREASGTGFGLQSDRLQSSRSVSFTDAGHVTAAV